MRLTRRNALIGLGTVAAGAGVVGGSGAFTSVEADRSVSVSTTGDSGAALQIAPSTEDNTDITTGTITQNAAEYTNADGPNSLTGDTFSFTLDKLNINATTSIEQLFVVVNNGTQAVNLDFQMQTDGGSDLSTLSGISRISIVDSNGNTYDLSSNGYVPGTPIPITEGGKTRALGLEIEIPEGETPGSFSLDLIIRARAQ
jgi:hypothetical protein